MKNPSPSTEKLQEMEVAVAPRLLNVPVDSNSHGYSEEIVGAADGKTVVGEKEVKCSERELRATHDQVNSAKENVIISVTSRNVLGKSRFC